ncbi:MAG: anhydro-N-acetylmuramic acid kinase [Planctomycetota bacterium]|jgi:anhydro-N-acetylmuramic acid kinase
MDEHWEANVTDRIHEIRQLEQRHVIGLNIGTSLDGIDAALLKVQGSGLEAIFGLEAFEMFPLPARLKRFLIDPLTLKVRDLAFLHRDLGQLLAEACSHLTDRSGLKAQDIHLVGSHGVTVFHEPPRHDVERGVSVQLGDPAIIAERTGAIVVSNFRAADLAAGGQGAPIMPFLDYHLFRSEPGTMLLNLGGIGNVCYVGASPEEVIAFDTGPANLPLNELTRILTNDKESFDRDGKLASMGTIDNLLLEQFTKQPFLEMPPPKSTGREEFGEEWVASLLARNKHRNLIDILATMTVFVAHAVKKGYDEWIAPRPLRRVVVSGGGTHNQTLIHHLRRRFDPVPVESLMDHGHDPDAKEAILFAMLANDRIFDHPTSLPSATGALWPVSLGQIS